MRAVNLAAVLLSTDLNDAPGRSAGPSPTASVRHRKARPAAAILERIAEADARSSAAIR